MSPSSSSFISSLLFIMSPVGLHCGLERFPWRQKQTWCSRGQKWIIQSGEAVCVRVCLRDSVLGRLFFFFGLVFVMIRYNIALWSWCGGCMRGGLMQSLVWHHFCFRDATRPRVHCLRVTVVFVGFFPLYAQNCTAKMSYFWRCERYHSLMSLRDPTLEHTEVCF